jgi:hypothetical protein
MQMRHVGPAASGQGLEALPKFPRSAGEPWATVYEGPLHVIFGHHARRRLQVRALLLHTTTLHCATRLPAS